MSANADVHILAIDLGTSGPKVALYTAKGELIGCEFEPVPLLLLPNGGAEQDPQDWWLSIRKATNRLLGKNLVDPVLIATIGCTTQWSGTVAVDEAGQPLMNAIIWMDSRGAPYVQRITSGPIKLGGYGVDKLFHWIRLTGGIPVQSGKDPIAHILYIQNELPEIYRRTHKFLEPKDYINLVLTGKMAASTDSITLHWLTDNRDLSRISYNQKLIRYTGIDREKLPELKLAVDILGPIKPQVAAQLGLSEGVQVIMGTPDMQSAALGAGAVKDFQAHAYIGTSSWVVCHVPYKKTDVMHNICTLPSAIPNRYFVIDEQETAGACLAYLKDKLFFPKDEPPHQQPIDAYQILERMAESVPAGSEGLIFMPWLYGERTPVDDRYVRGGFFNLSLRHTRAHLARSVYEGVALNTRWLLEIVEKFVDRRLEPINLAGGGASSNLWCQIYADVMGRIIHQVKDPFQANTRGVAYLAAVAMGYLKFEDIPDQVPIINTYHPKPENHRIYDQHFRELVGLYQRNAKAFARLNKA
jgi:xylulokinase